MPDETVPDLYRLAFVPGAFRCPKCDFRLTKTTLSVALGQAGTVEADRESEPCPNDGTMMVHVTYREAAEEYADRFREVLDVRDSLDRALAEIYRVCGGKVEDGAIPGFDAQLAITAVQRVIVERDSAARRNVNLDHYNQNLRASNEMVRAQVVELQNRLTEICESLGKRKAIEAPVPIILVSRETKIDESVLAKYAAKLLAVARAAEIVVKRLPADDYCKDCAGLRAALATLEAE